MVDSSVRTTEVGKSCSSQGSETALAPFTRPDWQAVSVILGLTALTFARTLTFDFVYDDVVQIKQNPQLTSWSYLPRYFVEHVWAFDRLAAADFYRPIFLVWLRVQYAIFGLNPAGWHTFSVLLHCAATGLLYQVAKQLGLERRASFVAALIFGLSPLHVESVSWVSASPDLLAAIFLLSSLSLLLGFQASSKLAQGLAAWLCFLCALLCKETAVAFPLVVVAISCFVSQPQGRFTRALGLSIPYFVLTAVYLSWRIHVLGGLAHTGAINHTLHGWFLILLNQPALLWFYVRHLLAPLGLSGFYDFPVAHTVGFRTVLLPIASLIVVFLLLVVLAWRSRSYFCAAGTAASSAMLVGAIWTICLLLPVLDIGRLKPKDYIHDRYLYLPSLGFYLAAGVLICVLAARFSLGRRTYQVVVCVLVLAFATTSIAESGTWKNDGTLYQRALVMAPSNGGVRSNLAAYWIEHGNIRQAVPLLQQTIVVDPRNWQAHINLADCYEALGDLEGSEKQWALADQIQSDPEIKAGLERIRRLLAAQGDNTPAPKE